MVAAWNLAARTVQAGGVVDYQPILVVLLGMTTVTITGVFVFMTFRIDRGTKRKAKDVAKSSANKALMNIKKEAKDDLDTMNKDTKKDLNEMKEDVGEDLKEMKQDTAADLDAIKTKTSKILENMVLKSTQQNDSVRQATDSATLNFNNTLTKIAAESDRRIDEAIRERMDKQVTPEVIQKEVTARISGEELRKDIEAVLMMKVNGQIIAEYAKRHADALNSEAFKRLIHLLDEVIRTLSPEDSRKRGSGDVSWWGRLKAYFTR